MTSKIKVDNINKVSDDSNIINKCGTTVTVGAASDGVRTGADNLQAADGGNLISQSGTTITLGASGDTITLASGASQTGFGRTGTVDWQTGSIKTATFTAASGEGYFCNTAGGAFEMDLPAGSAGAIVSVQDYNNTFDTHALTVDPNGSEKINGGDGGESVELDTEGRGVTFVYIDSTVGWRSVQDNDFIKKGVTAAYIAATGGTVLTNGNFKTHIFTGPGTFCVSAGSGPLGIADYTVIAGGGGGANPTSYGGGGGGGGFRISNSTGCVPAPTMSPLIAPAALSITAGAYPIVVGAAGSAGSGVGAAPNGSVSTFSSITSAGGGGGSNDGYAGADGGSGGGGSGGNPTPSPDSKQGGAGNTPPVSPPQGNNGGQGNPGPQAPQGGEGGGGGGAGAVGQDAPGPSQAGAGGSGSFVADTVFGPTAPSYGTSGPVSSTRYFSGGGGGGTDSSGTSRGAGGDGGGGQGAPSSAAGTTNTGGGGGGSSHSGNPPSTGSAGGSGIVIIRYRFQA
jgi:hypothetical protein